MNKQSWWSTSGVYWDGKSKVAYDSYITNKDNTIVIISSLAEALLISGDNFFKSEMECCADRQ